MTDTTVPTSVQDQPGRLTQALRRMFMTHARVISSEQVAPDFHLVTLESSGFRDVDWVPGQKVQVAMGKALAARTFTPIDWDPLVGRTRILGYAHGEGPAGRWLRAVANGHECDIFGPRASLDTRRVEGPVVVLGDETSIGLAYAVLHGDRARAMECIFEIGDITAARTVLARLGLARATLVPRAADGAHLEAMEAHLRRSLRPDATYVLTGKAPTIQCLRAVLKQADVSTGRIMAKAYWAPGKTGLD